MPNIKLPDGKQIKFDKPISGFDICNKIIFIISNIKLINTINHRFKKDTKWN